MNLDHMTLGKRIRTQIHQAEQIQPMSEHINNYEMNHIINCSIYNEVKKSLKQLKEVKASDGELITIDQKRYWKLVLPGPCTGSLQIHEKEQTYLQKLHVSKLNTYMNDEGTYQLAYHSNRFNREDGWGLNYIGTDQKGFLYYEVKTSKISKFTSCIHSIIIHPSKALKRYIDLYTIEAKKEDLEVRFYPQLLVEHKVGFTNHRSLKNFDQFDTWYTCDQEMISEIENTYVKIEIRIEL